MATTGFWPVKDRLKEVIDYAENPDKTIDKKYVDSDLYAALRYVSNGKKTDERMYVSGVNCNAKRAYERMTATKKRFGKTGGMWHTTATRASRPAKPRPKKRTKSDWKPQSGCGETNMKLLLPLILIQTMSIIILFVNSVSFKTGRKFENHISDHYRLRENLRRRMFGTREKYIERHRVLRRE